MGKRLKREVRRPLAQVQYCITFGKLWEDNEPNNSPQIPPPGKQKRSKSELSQSSGESGPDEHYTDILIQEGEIGDGNNEAPFFGGPND